MKRLESFFHCGDQLRQELADEIIEIGQAIGAVPWSPSYSDSESRHEHQSGYNRAFSAQFLERGWEAQPQAHGVCQSRATPLKLRTAEADKVRCGKKHFEAIGVPFDVVVTADEV
jgi:hypothetical protein